MIKGPVTDVGSVPLSSDWVDLMPSVKPSARFLPAMAYDSQSYRTILFGGAPDIGTFSYETWSYDSQTNTWTIMNPTSNPSARLLHAMAYDSQSDRIILFGGRVSVSYLGVNGETWAYDYNANVWTNRNPTYAPSARYGHAMAYDSQSDRVILFGGYTGGDTFNERDVVVRLQH